MVVVMPMVVCRLTSLADKRSRCNESSGFTMRQRAWQLPSFEHGATKQRGKGSISGDAVCTSESYEVKL